MGVDMPTKKQNNPTNKYQGDRIDLITFGVGHGDCLLIEFIRDNKTAFRLLYDCGAKLPSALLKHLQENRAENRLDLDIVALSHVDHDHQGGLHALLANKSISIGELWLPCLPAFERLSWLFAKRVAEAIAEAKKLEDIANRREITVIYPMEDHVERFVDGGAITISVISPARKLLKRLYYGDELVIEELLGHLPLPLEWLVRSEISAVEFDQGDQPGSPFDGNTAVSRAMLPTGAQLDGLSQEGLVSKAARSANAQKQDFDPNFFGNNVLNDTSLVIVVDAVLNDHHRRRIVLAGDQENWSYISSQYPMGLGPDVLKVPHHGGRIYLGDINRIKIDEFPSSGISQFLLWTRPRIAIVSANGTHNLPRFEFREAIRSIGTTLVCPNKRTREIIFSGGQQETPKSCYQLFGCQAEDQHHQLRLSLSVQNEDLDAAACLQGNCHRGPAPVVVMQQKLIEPDESFVRWTTAEVRKHAHWLAGFLKDERKKLLQNTENSITANFSVPLTAWDRIAAEAKSVKRAQFAGNPEPVLRYASAHGLIWAKDELRYAHKPDLIAAFSDSEYSQLISWVKKCKGLLIALDNVDQRAIARKDWFDLLRTANFDPLMKIWSAWAGLPFEIFKKEIGPRLLLDIQRIYSARIASLKNPEIAPPQNGSKAILHLYSKSKIVQDFFSEKWLSSAASPGYGLNEKRLGFILGSAQRGVIPPLNNYYNNGIDLDLELLHPFVTRDIISDEWGSITKVKPRVFPNRFSNAKWIDLWVL